MVVRLSGCVVAQDLGPVQGSADGFPIGGVDRGGGQPFNGIRIGISHFGDGHVRGGQIAFHPVLGDVDGSLDAPFGGGQFRKVGQLLLIALLDPLLKLLDIRDIDADREDGLSAVLGGHGPPGVVDPDVRPVFFLHPVLYDVLVPLGELLVHGCVHLGPVVGVHAVGDQAADVGNKIRLVPVAQVVQHPSVDEVIGEALLQIAAHHSAGQGIVEQLLPGLGDVFQNKSLGVMLPALLVLAGLGDMEAFDPPVPAGLLQDEEAPQAPGVVAVLQLQLHGVIAHALTQPLCLEREELHLKGLRDLPDILPDVGGHLIPALGGFPLAGAYEAHVLRQEGRRPVRVAPLEPGA